MHTVTGDACLYVESFIQLMAATKIRSTTGRQLVRGAALRRTQGRQRSVVRLSTAPPWPADAAQVSNALAYYFGAVDIPPDQLMLSITGVDTPSLRQTLVGGTRGHTAPRTVGHARCIRLPCSLGLTPKCTAFWGQAGSLWQPLKLA